MFILLQIISPGNPHLPHSRIQKKHLIKDSGAPRFTWHLHPSALAFFLFGCK
jgi:hypothetical protein